MSLIANVREDPRLVRLMRHTAAIREHWAEVNWMKEALREDDGLKLLEVWLEMTRETQIALWSCAPRDGGIWTTAERAQIRAWASQQERTT